MDQMKIPEDIKNVVDTIVERFSPQKIYLFSNKRKGVGKSAGFKLCIVVESENMHELERQIYLEVDCDVPFDIVLYKPTTWAELMERKGSFATRIDESGVVVYG